jgi:hypothetical protein
MLSYFTQLWDHDLASSDDFLGHVDIALYGISKSSPLQGAFNLSDDAKKAMAKASEARDRTRSIRVAHRTCCSQLHSDLLICGIV